MPEHSARELCAKCSSIFLNRNTVEEALESKYLHVWEGLDDGGRMFGDCYLCEEMQRGLWDRYKGGRGEAVHLDKPGFIFGFRLEETKSSEPLFSISIGSYPPFKTYFICTASDDLAAREIGGRVANPSVQNFDVVRSWLEECPHHGCPTPSEQPLPSRILDVSSSLGKDYVHLSQGKEKSGKYAALSYVWGTKPGSATNTVTTDESQIGAGTNFRTTTHNLLENEAGIHIEQLPQTLKDAVKVTRELGLRYLWIDAICIVQDSEEEKQREIAIMDKIYANSFVTISAGSSQSVWDGFLQDRASNAHEPSFSMPYRCADGRVGNLDFIELVSGYRPGSGYWGDNNDPINTRAWTLQETLLAPRLLAYSLEQVFYLCENRLRKDGGLWTEEGLAYVLGWPRLWYADKYENQLSRWRLFVSQYSSRNLTVAEDKLPALAAVATTFQRLLDDQYVAGMWMKSIHHDLLWLSTNEGPNEDPYLAPSWSWVSTKENAGYGPWQSVDLEPVAIVHTAVTTPVWDFSPLGKIKDGRIIIEGPLVEAEIRRYQGRTPKEPIHVSKEFSDVYTKAMDMTDEDRRRSIEWRRDRYGWKQLDMEHSDQFSSWGQYADAYTKFLRPRHEKNDEETISGPIIFNPEENSPFTHNERQARRGALFDTREQMSFFKEEEFCVEKVTLTSREVVSTFVPDYMALLSTYERKKVWCLTVNLVEGDIQQPLGLVLDRIGKGVFQRLGVFGLKNDYVLPPEDETLAEKAMFLREAPVRHIVIV